MRAGLKAVLAVWIATGCGFEGERPEQFGTSSAGLTNGIFINEVLANEPGIDASAEFVELVNPTPTAVSLGHWTISDAAAVRHTFPSGTVVAAGDALVVVASGASTGSLGLNNGGDTITVRDSSGAVVDAVSYSAALTSVDGASMNRKPDATAGVQFVLHTVLSSSRASPQTRADGSAFGAPGPTPAPGGERLRLMAANLSSGNAQSYDPGQGIRIFQGLKPDVVMIQELNFGSNSPTELRAFVDTAFSAEYAYYRQPSVQLPNGVISRYPIIAAGVWDDTAVTNRDFVWARIDRRAQPAEGTTNVAPAGSLGSFCSAS